jgi:hypothetical protein
MGLRVTVLRPAGRSGDCTNGGVTSRYDTLTLINVDGPSDPSPDAPAARLELSRGRTLRIVPAEVGVNWSMFGGNYVTGDDRLSRTASRLLECEAFYYPIPVHDRVEA